MDAPSFADGTIDAPTPCLVVDNAALDANIAAMAEVNPGVKLRPHVKAFKSTALAQRLADNGHAAFTCATLGEAAGLMQAGLGSDVLLANETLNAAHIARVTSLPGRLTLAVDSSATVEAAAAGNATDVLVDVNVGLPRCGCAPDDAGRIADEARAAGLNVRGVMGYEGHLMMVEDRAERIDKVSASMELLLAAADVVGGDIVSSGGTGTFDTNTAATEIQAGSYALMDTQYLTLDLPFRLALWVEATVISVNAAGGWIVADAGLKALGMDHGNPHWDHGKVWFCSDEHITLGPTDIGRWSVGDRVRLAPAHVDPTVAKHERMWVVADGAVTAEWAVDLRHW